MPKCEMLESIPLHAQGLNCGINICELEEHVGEKGLSSNWPTKLGFAKKTLFASFPSCLLENA